VVAFKISINGDRLCTAGVDGEGALSTILHCSTERVPQLCVGGSDHSAELLWLDQNLAVGDVVTVEIVDAAVSDMPSRCPHPSPEDQNKRRREYAERILREM
jgi:hypothetical protein